MCLLVFFFCKQKTAYEMRISDWSSDVCSSDLLGIGQQALAVEGHLVRRPQEAQLLRLEGRLRHLGQADGLEGRRHRWHRPLGTARIARIAAQQDRKSVVSGKSVSVRVDLGGRRIIKKKTTKMHKTHKQ